MVNKQLANWISSKKAEGYTDDQIRSHLIKNGHDSPEIDEIMDPPEEKQTTNLSFSAQKVFKPEPLKFVLPALFFIIVFVSFFVNNAVMPTMAEELCDSVTATSQLQARGTTTILKGAEFGVDQAEMVALYQEESDLMQEAQMPDVDKYYKPFETGNLYFSLIMGTTNYPLPSTPCETQLMGIASEEKCRYYISEETYNCIQSNGEEETQVGGGMYSIDAMPPYKKVSFFVLLIETILLAGVLYLLVCLVFFLNRKMFPLSVLAKTGVYLGLVIIPLLAADHIVSFFVLLPFIITFIITSMIKSEKKKDLLLYTLSGVFVVLLIGGMFVFRVLVFWETGIDEIEYTRTFSAAECQNATITLTDADKEKLGLEGDILSEEWVVCDTCKDICFKECGLSNVNARWTYFDVRGETPSCICGCWEEK